MSSIHNSFYSKSELVRIGFKSLGYNVLISRHARIYNPEKIEIGNNIRIDDFCILSGNIKLGNHIHISAYTALYAKFGIEMEDYTGLSPRCTIFSATDDFSGDFMIGPMIDDKFTNVHGGKVIIKKFSQIGSNCVILPALTVFEGVAVGAMSLVTHDLNEWSIYKGIPAKFHKQRSKKILDFNLNEH
jgi:acetyltransferase-like isoleucine patch superfamily enzyme